MTDRERVRKKIHNAGSNPYITSVIVVLASVCDFITIKSVMEFYLTEAVIIQVVITAAVAFILNYIPSLLGRFVRDKNAENRKLLITILAIAFIALFVMTFALRWNSRALMFEDTSALNLSGTMNAVSDQSMGSGENTLTIIMGCSTLFTSLISFVFSLTAMTAKERREQIIELRLIELETKRDFYLNHIEELEKVIEENANALREEQAYSEAIERLHTYEDIFKEQVRLVIAEQLQSPETVSIVLQREEPVMV